MIRALIVDSSPERRKKLSSIIEKDPSIDVVCKTGDLLAASNIIEWMEPNVVILRPESCEEEGLSFFTDLIKSGVPVVVTANGEGRNCEKLIDLLEKGAVEYIDFEREGKNVTKKIKAAAWARPLKLDRSILPVKVCLCGDEELKKIVVIASSTGGPQTLRQIIPKLPESLPSAIIVVQHMGKGFVESFSKSIAAISKLHVKIAEDGEEIRKGHVYFAPYGRHLEIKGREIHLLDGRPLNGVMPAADPTMTSAAKSFGKNTIGVVLTGMGRDGAKGVRDIKKEGGRIIVQDLETCIISGMPTAALRTGKVDRIVDIEEIAQTITREVCR